MTSIIPGPWFPPIWQQNIEELQATISEKEAEILRLLRVYRAAIFMREALEGISSGKVLPGEQRRKAEVTLRWLDREFPELGEMVREGV